MKTELLVQMDGLKGIKSDEQIFVMAASNTPWDLDIAVLVRNWYLIIYMSANYYCYSLITNY